MALALIGFISVLILLWTFDYNQLSHFFLKLADKTDWKTYFQTKIMTQQVFLSIRILSIFCLCGYIVFLYKFFNKAKTAANILKTDFMFYRHEILKIFETLTLSEKLLLLGVFLLFISRAIFHIHNYELQYDEAWTYLHFSSKGILISMLSPNNNHVLYTIFSAAFDCLSFPPKLAVRLPAFISGLAALLVFFLFVKRVFGNYTAFIALIMSALSGSFYFFSILGRGYGLMLFFVILSMVAWYGLLFGNEKHRGIFLRLYVFCTVLGLYSSFAFIYICALNIPLLFISLPKNKVVFKPFIVANLTAFIIVTILYLPMILGGGITVLSSAADVAFIDSRGNFWLYLNRLADWLILGNGAALFWLIPTFTILFFASIFILFKTEIKKQKLLYISLINWIAPFLLFMITSIEVPFRVWSYVQLFFFIIAAAILTKLFKNRIIPYFVSISIAIFTFYTSENHYFMNWSANLDRDSKKIAELIMQKTDSLNNVYCFSRYDKPLLEYYFQINEKKVNIYMPFIESHNYRPFSETVYDAVLLDTEDYKVNSTDLDIINRLNYQLVYTDKRLKLYIRKIK